MVPVIDAIAAASDVFRDQEAILLERLSLERLAAVPGKQILLDRKRLKSRSLI
jgi:hypothetical protein